MKSTDLDQTVKATILLAAVAVHAPVLMLLSRRRRRSSHPVLRYVLWGVSAMYFPLMSYVLSYLSTYLSPDSDNDEDSKAAVLVAVVLTQFLRAKADMAALAVAAVASPVAGDDDINSLKIRPSMENLVYTFWVAGLVIYSIFFAHKKKGNNNKMVEDDKTELQIVAVLISPLWLLGAVRMVLRFASFKKATGSFALGRNVQLIDGYMMQLKEDDELHTSAVLVPRLIVTGERNRDVEESPTGYRVKRSTLEDRGRSRRLITLDQVWTPHVLPEPELRFRDLCLSFALFKCLRRRFAGCQLAEAGRGWAFRFVADGLVGRGDDHVRVFRVIADELSFARDFYYSALPVASLGTVAASLHFFVSFLILALLCILSLPLLLVSFISNSTETFYLVLLSFVLTLVNACSEISDMVSSLRSNWTKISIIGHYVRCQNSCARRILSCLMRCKSPKLWSDKIGQTELFPAHGLSSKTDLVKQLFLRCKSRHKPVIMVPPEVKAAVLRSFRRSDGQLSAGEAAVGRRAFGHDITWACEITTTTNFIIVWHVATSLFETRFSSPRAVSSSSSTSANKNNILVAGSLSRYCMYLVAEAPDLLLDNPAWIKGRYDKVKKKTDEVLSTLRRSHVDVPDQAAGVYGQLVDAFSSEEGSHELLKEGAKLGKQLVEEAEKSRDAATGAGEDAVWELLAEFWSEMVLYIAPSDNVKSHIEALQRGGELVTLLWALLLHAGITTRPARRHVPVAEP